MCEKILLFSLRVLSMYLTSYDLHLLVFRAFFAFLVEVGDSKRRLTQGAWIEKLRKHNLGEHCPNFIPNTKLCLFVNLRGVPI